MYNCAYIYIYIYIMFYIYHIYILYITGFSLLGDRAIPPTSDICSFNPAPGTISSPTKG